MFADTYSEFEFLAAFAGAPSQFWPRYRAHAQHLFGADGSCLLLQAPAEGVRVLSQDSAGSARHVLDSGVADELGKMSDGAIHEWAQDLWVIGLPVGLGPSLWLVLIGSEVEDRAKQLREVRLLAESYQARRREQRTSDQVMGLSEVLDLGLNLGESSDFSEASLRLCHRVAALSGASRVSLAWLEAGVLQLRATSHGGRISESTQEAEALVRVMEEAADQNNEVGYPGIAGSDAINREHQIFSQSHLGTVVLSVPIRDAVNHQVQGVLLLERPAEDGGWNDQELERLRLSTDLVASRLSDLHESSGWWGKRLWRKVRHHASGWLGTEHTGWKFASVVLVITLLLLLVIRVEHKVRAPFLLKTDAAALATAPFAGFIDEVRYHVGDVVKSGQVLVTLDRRDLLLEEANAIAGRDKNDREARAYEAQGKLAEALMAKSAKRQDEARLAIINRRLEMAEIRAPFDGIVVEGDLRERLSSPVQIGERLFKIVQVRDLVGQLQVDERDIGYVSQSQSGALAFASRPGDRFDVSIERFEPVAEVRQEGNIFVLRVKVHGEPQDWWRPGMSGICKINTGKSSLLWVLTHRTVETIRMWLWL